MPSRFLQLYELAADPDEDTAQCARADLFHEFKQFNYQMDTPRFETMSPRQFPIRLSPAPDQQGKLL